MSGCGIHLNPLDERGLTNPLLSQDHHRYYRPVHNKQ